MLTIAGLAAASSVSAYGNPDTQELAGVSRGIQGFRGIQPPINSTAGTMEQGICSRRLEAV